MVSLVLPNRFGMPPKGSEVLAKVFEVLGKGFGVLAKGNGVIGNGFDIGIVKVLLGNVEHP